MIEIKYKESRIREHLKIGWICILVGIALFFFNAFSFLKYGKYGLIAGGILSLLYYAFEKNRNYVTIDGQYLKIHSLIPKVIMLTQISSVQNTKRGYKVSGKSKVLLVKTNFIDDAEAAKLGMILARLVAV